jgi:hypothetical protein
MKVDPGFKLYSPVLTRPAGRPRKNRIRASAEGGAPIRRRKCKRCGTPGHIARLCKNPVDPAFGLEDQAGAANAEENKAAIQHEEIEAMNRELLELMDRELVEPMDRELLEPMDPELLEQMNRELLELMDREQREQMDLEAVEAMHRQLSEGIDRELGKPMDQEQIVKAREENALEERAQASYDMVVSVLAQPEEKKNKKEGKRKVDTGNIPGRVTRSKVVDPASHTRSKRKILF